MSASLLLMGTLPRAAEAKTSKAGKAYASASVKVANGSELEFWNVLAFADEVREALLACSAGERVSLQGMPRFEPSTNGEGELKIRKSLFVDAILTARPKPKARKPKAVPVQRESFASGPRAPAVLDDPIPW